MKFTVEFEGRRYSVQFFRVGLPSEVKRFMARPAPKNDLWVSVWNSFSKHDPSETVQKVIAMATHMREARLAFDPRFPLMD